MVLRHGLSLATVGIIVGLLGAFVLTRLMASQLHAVQPNDPVTFATVAVLLLLIAVAACVPPALRATRVSPTVALRAE
jgi:ABC-type antimicrobial peptide transport system permease subunit